MEFGDSLDANAAQYAGLSLAVLLLADIRERFIRSGVRLDRRSEVRATRTGVDCRSYADGPILELYLEADVEGRTLCWWLEAKMSGQDWRIETSVLENRADTDRQEELHAFPVRLAADTQSFVTEVTSAAEALLDTTEDSQFITPAV